MGNKKIVWIGTFIPKDKISEASAKGYRQIAANISQQYFIDGIEKSVGESIDIISAIRVPSYPKYLDLIVRRYNFSHSVDAKDINVGFINAKYFSHLSRQHALIKAVRQWAKTNRNKDINIIVYAMCTPFLKAAVEIKSLIPSAKITLIVLDLPLNMDMSSFIQRKLKKIDWRYINKLKKHVDKYVLFTKEMANYLKLDEKQWIVIEGMMDADKTYSNEKNQKTHQQVCLYAGSLEKKYGIDVLTKAFIAAKIKDAVLHIYGDGDFKSELIEICKRNPNIKYMGFISSDIVFERMKEATLLINPRPTKDDYTKYSFPSKTLEYLASGSPLLTTKLPGIPDEYFEYIFTFEDESIEGMKNKLLEILDLRREDLDSKGKKAQEFIRTRKSSEIQSKKILDFVGLDHKGINAKC